MKKLIALLLALGMIFGLVACSSNTPSGSTTPTPSASQPADPTDEPGTDGPATDAKGRYPAETIKIGFVNYDTSAEQTIVLGNYFDYLANYFNFEILWSESISSAEEELDFIDACAAAGCKAVIGYYNVSNEQALLKCAERGMYYWGQGGNPAYQEYLDNEYYIGSFYAGDADYDYGYGCIEMLVEAGAHKIAGVSGGARFGVDIFIKRWQGAMDAIEHFQSEGYDIELVYEVQGFPGTDGTFEAGQSAVLDNPEIDGLFSSLSALMWISPMQEAGRFGYDAGDKRIIVAAAGETMSDAAIGMFGAGFYVGTATEIIDTFGLAIPMIINAVDGHAADQRADGKALLVPVGWWKVTNVEDAGYYGSVQGGDNGWAFDKDDVMSLLYAYNPDLTTDDFGKLYTSVTAAEIQARHASH